MGQRGNRRGSRGSRRRFSGAGKAVAGLAAAAGVWGHFEAGWLRRRTLETAVPRLPEALAGLRIVHLSDFHLGFPSRGAHAVEQAVEWAAERQPDLVCVTGDLLSRRRGEPALRRLLARLPSCYAVLGNHDLAISRDPFSQRSEVRDLEPTTLLADESRVVELRGHRVQVAGIDPRSWYTRRADPGELVDETAELRILLCHVPKVIERLEPGWFHLVLAGHMHAGQITLPHRRGRVRLAHLSARWAEGLYSTGVAVMHVSPGLGTTFVPFRFFARPEATELVLQTGPYTDTS